MHECGLIGLIDILYVSSLLRELDASLTMFANTLVPNLADSIDMPYLVPILVQTKLNILELTTHHCIPFSTMDTIGPFH